ncbi:hypothetical protein LEMLEM_LOCUS13716 [Lemmus lemmus]
MTPSGI